jgi:glutathione synthase/RimK-type ligase-like ATP-grasp enzyme
LGNKKLSSDEQKILNLEENLNNWYIIKPASKFGGEGIHLIKNISEFKEKLR